LACAAALETLAIIEDEGLVRNAAEMGGLLIERFSALANEIDAIDHIRGKGLLLGLELSSPVARELAAECFERGLVLNAIGTDILRLAPPLMISESQCEQAVETIAGVLEEIA
ncbi:MAG: aminotransferase class III-fold pyridoxal phosphate-dependent enzyme, partial [Armatimonadota bacterium]